MDCLLFKKVKQKSDTKRQGAEKKTIKISTQSAKNRSIKKAENVENPPVKNHKKIRLILLTRYKNLFSIDKLK